MTGKSRATIEEIKAAFADITTEKILEIQSHNTQFKKTIFNFDNVSKLSSAAAQNAMQNIVSQASTHLATMQN